MARQIYIFVVLLTVTASGSVTGETSDALGLVVDVVEEESLAYRDIEEKLQEVLPKPQVLVRYRVVEIDANWFIRSDIPDAVDVEFFDDYTCHAIKKGVQDGWQNIFTWKGSCDPFGEHVARISKSPMGFITATLNTPGADYKIQYLRGSTHVILETDASKYALLPSSE